MKQLIIDGVEAKAGEETVIELNVAQLPTRTKITVPVTIYRAKQEGPTLLLMAGLHGDEINGTEIIRRFLDSDYNKVKRGTVICIPILNVYGFINFSREVPDGKDVNRSFPGSENGSLAAKVAHELMNKIIPHIDYGIDFHTGGGQRSNYPQIRAEFSKETNRFLGELFNPPFLIHSNFIERSLRWAAEKVGKEILVYEGGESLRFNQFAIQEGIYGALRVMKGLNMIDKAPKQALETIEITSRTWLRALSAGMWVHKCKEGDKVKEGQLLGYTTSPFGDFRTEIYSPYEGYIIGINYLSIVNRGDALIHIGK